MANNKESSKAGLNNGVEAEEKMAAIDDTTMNVDKDSATGADIPEESKSTSETDKSTAMDVSTSPESEGAAATAVKTRNTKKKTIIAVVAVVVVAALVLVYFLFFQNRSGPNRAVTAGQNIVVTVMADKLEGVYGYQFEMNYNTAALEFVRDGGLVSKIDDISTIFSVDQGSYELVGATMIGEASGASGQDMAVCEMIFTAKKDGALSDYGLALQNVNVVDSNLEYVENIEGWYCTFSVE